MPNMFSNTGKPNARIIRWVIIGVVAILLIILATSSFAIVPPGHTGVVVQLGAVSDNVLPAGIHAVIPFVTRVVNMNNQVKKVDVDASSASKDLQTLESTISLNYRVDEDSSARLYMEVGEGYEEVIIRPAIQECVKAVTARYTAEELITKRQTVGDEMRELVIEKIDVYGLRVEIFNIINFNFSEEFNKAIESKQTAQQNALRAEQELERIKLEAQQKVEQAKAEAEAIRTTAEAEAFATRTSADAESYAIEKIQQQLTREPAYVQYMLALAWDGKQPLVMGAEGSILDIGRVFDMAPSDENAVDNNNGNGNGD